MLFIRLCFDKPGTESLRNEHRAAHRAYLSSGAAKLVQAGPLMDDDNEHNIASFMVVEAGSLQEAKRFHDEDPFTKAGLFERSFVHIWDKHVG
jgi:uncharacterized protein